MAEEFEITDEMRAQIGKETPPWDSEVTTTSVRAFARGVGYTDLVYFDEAVAKKAGYKSLPAPPTYLGTPIFIPGKSDDTFSAPREGAPSVNHGLTGLLDGGTSTEYFEGITAGDVLEVRTSISDLQVKATRSLGKMLVLSMKTTFKNKETGNLAAVQIGQVLYY
jgi:hypothetical protein